VVFIGDVIVVFKIIPKEMGMFEEVKKGLKELEPQRLEEEPVAFGLKALKFTKLVPDEEGKLTELEEKIKKIKGVQTCETVAISRSL
jgi:elongation factor 1-beta